MIIDKDAQSIVLTKNTLLNKKVAMHCGFSAINNLKAVALFRKHNVKLVIETEMETGRVDRPVGSRFFDRPVKPVEKPVEFSFLATKRHLSTNRNIPIYFIMNKTSYKNQCQQTTHFENTC